MKKMRFLMIVLFCMMASTLPCRADQPISIDKLPLACKTFVKKTFPTQTVVQATQKEDNFVVSLNNGAELAFNHKGIWTRVDCKTDPVPSKLVPSEIYAYVRTYYKGNAIVKIEKEKAVYDVVLSNGQNLKFNKKGYLIE